MITVEKTLELVKKFGRNEKDTGSPAVQIAILTERIGNLTGHFAGHKLDHHSKRGLMKIIGQRRSLLRYLSQKDEAAYKKLIAELGIRK